MKSIWILAGCLSAALAQASPAYTVTSNAEHVLGTAGKKLVAQPARPRVEPPRFKVPEEVAPQPFRTIVLDGIASGKAEVSAAHQAQLAQLAPMLHKAKDLVLTGHTDDRGSNEYNQRLGLRRAEAVQAWLGLQSISATVRSEGEQMPAASNGTPAGQAANRRVTLDGRY